MTATARRGARRLGAVMAVAAGLAACGDSPTEVDIREVDFAPELGVNLDEMEHLGDDLYVEDRTVGEGAEAAAGDSVRVHYTGWLADGTKFDSSHDRGQPSTFHLATGAIIEGWVEGVAGMRVGGVRLLAVPPELGYGDREVGSIPPNSVLVFEVELLDVTPEEP